MTTANVLSPGLASTNTANVAGNTNANQNAVSKSTAKMFQGYMKQYDKADAMGGTTQTIASKGKAGTDNSIADYTKTHYKGNQIQQNSQSTLEEKVNDSKELIQSTEKEIVQTVAEELGVDASEVEEVMETLGLLALQLLQPENLVQLVSQLTGTTDPAELLVNVNFQDLMQNMSAIGNEFYQAMDIQPNQLDELVAQMDILEEPVNIQNVEVTAESVALSDGQEASVGTSDQQTSNPLDLQETPETHDSEENGKVQVEAVEEDNTDSTAKASQLQDEESTGEESESQEQSKGEHQKLNAGDQRIDTGENQVFTTNMNSDAVQTNAAVQPAATPMFSQPVNQLEIIQQIAEQVKVIVGTEETSMEMQLNPENLGKVYLEISSKQGNVSAQITAQNEAVRDAIQAQVATLQDRLNQAGVKVDAIEVTVASHEFERNLEQNQSGKEQGENQSEQMRSGRRNLHMNSLDDLEGLMSEEELLAAQIMKDNGNTVDLTA